jgi:hypothetical protein
VWLDVGVLGPEEGLGAVYCKLLRHVDPLAAAVVALTRESFGVLVRQDRAGGFEDRLRDEVLGCDQLEGVLLALELVVKRLGDLRIDDRERLAEVVWVKVRQLVLRGRGCVPRL